jgi:hypothetical protein
MTNPILIVGAAIIASHRNQGGWLEECAAKDFNCECPLWVISGHRSADRHIPLCQERARALNKLSLIFYFLAQRGSAP